MEEGTAAHSTVPAWEILWTEEPGHSLWGHERVGHGRATWHAHPCQRREPQGLWELKPDKKTLLSPAPTQPLSEAPPVQVGTTGFCPELVGVNSILGCWGRGHAGWEPSAQQTRAPGRASGPSIVLRSGCERPASCGLIPKQSDQTHASKPSLMNFQDASPTQSEGEAERRLSDGCARVCFHRVWVWGRLLTSCHASGLSFSPPSLSSI